MKLTCLNEQFVREDSVVGSVVVPTFLVDASGGVVSVEGLLQANEPITEETEPEFRQSAVVVLDDLAPHELVGQHEAAELHHHLQRTKPESA